ncbi:MAG TPA: cation-translocating P-type ATPase, partial [Actinomycetales bacterium]|nr:cation-translocating P-type ATPase [Actinomycetales bacterium]
GLPADLLMLAAAVVAGLPIVVNAVKALRIRVIGIDLLVSVAAIGAIAIQNYWEAAAVTVLFAIGGALEDATLTHTRSALRDLVSTAPDVAIVIRDGEQVTIPAGAVRPGETVIVKAGARVPVDGEVTSGTGSLDEAAITGESLPVDKGPGAPVYAGTVSTAGLLQVRAEGVGANTTLARIIHRVEEAQDARARIQTFMEKFSAWYTPGIIVLALVGGLVTGNLELALTLLVIGCPGALVISIPVAIVAGIGRGAKDGVLIKGGEYLELSARISAVALDKTGTLTQGRPELTDVIPLGTATRTEVLSWAARVEAASDHPLAAPIVAAARAEGIELGHLPDNVQVVVGRGVRGTVDGRAVAIGNLALLREALSASFPDDDAASRSGLTSSRDTSLVDDAARVAGELASAGRTPMLLALDGVPLGVLAVADAIRPEAPEMIAELHRLGIREVVMLTGDQERVAQSVAARVGVDTVRAGLMPEDKLEAIRELQAAGHVVAMVGDGVNDAPALAAADIGIAMGAAGSGLAIETADIALMGDRLERLPYALGMARRTVAVMRQNIVISLVTVAALLAGVFAGGVTMSLGMLVHEASVLVVIANAMRLLRRRSGQGSVTENTPEAGRRSVTENAPGAGRADGSGAGAVVGRGGRDGLAGDGLAQDGLAGDGLGGDRLRSGGVRA